MSGRICISVTPSESDFRAILNNEKRYTALPEHDFIVTPAPGDVVEFTYTATRNFRRLVTHVQHEAPLYMLSLRPLTRQEKEELRA